MTTVTIRMPEDVIEDLKRVAPTLGFSGYQPLARAYIGQGLRADLERIDNDTVSALVDSLKRRGVGEDVIQAALSEVVQGASKCCGRDALRCFWALKGTTHQSDD